MELDLKYKQYSFNQNEVIGNENSESYLNQNKPYQELIDFFESHIEAFDYNKIKQLAKISEDIDVTLSDGSTIHVGVSGDVIIRFALKQPNGKGFIGYYCSTTDGPTLEPYL